VRGGEMRSFEVEPQTFGLNAHPIEALKGGDAKTNAQIARDILDGREGAPFDVVVANAGAALYVSGAAETLREGAAMARDSILKRKARRKLEELVAESHA
jgi:anthranilate phosphoribosyltransferase